MPKLKQTAADKQNARILGVIGYYRNYYGYSNRDLALAARVGKDTWLNRLKNPQNFKIKELDGLAWKFRIPITEFFEKNTKV